MSSLRLARTGSLVSVIALLALLNFTSLVSSSPTGLNSFNIASKASIPTQSSDAESPQSLSNNFTYYTIRPDVRRCASPMCGGFFIKRVNHPRTRCANGRSMDECYVAEINWNGQPPVESSFALLRGELSQRRYRRLGSFGVLRVTESWRAMSERSPQGTFFRVEDLGIRCITYPCMSHQEERLNSYGQRKIAGVELNGAHASDDAVARAGAAMTAEGILVAGNLAPMVGPAGRAHTLRATQFYLRGPAPVANKPCRKTGCSGQVCADEDVMTTCEWRPEYECYRRARCERQTNGECGFTQTSELTACLRRSR